MRNILFAIFLLLSSGCRSNPNKATVIKVERADDNLQEHIKMVLRTEDREFHVHCDQDLGASMSDTHPSVCGKYSAGEQIEIRKMVGTLYVSNQPDVIRGWTIDSEEMR